LRYRPGGHYKPHADSENWHREQRQWVRGMDRDYSILVYLNDGYDGGELRFPNFGFRLQPRAGLLVCFPSDHRYLHEVAPVTAGTRYALVSWITARGTPRVGGRPRDAMATGLDR
jgi:predicted 2-oxoglutarate/Fe(II)-dependent dioxygenase YbiX